MEAAYWEFSRQKTKTRTLFPTFDRRLINARRKMAESSFRLPSLLNVTDGNVTENFKKWKREF
ncbi:hypothetical protein DPMN_009571 [Dreissena polymorpha]|uniref:Uncharacterized protein n=1 Tax=Dreissena polymorpha TaxID=45954 RepID=A0A9D4MZV4_DREPO|nr:hypothetical protein DPMN_009571 [Dreissena polymorpha]